MTSTGVDGILLVLHGAMALVDHDDAEGLLRGAVRHVVGPDGPIIGPLDLHTNLSDEMLALCDAVVGYREYPHGDMPESGGRTVVLAIGGPGGLELPLTELRGHPADLNHFRTFGIEPTARRILVLRSTAHFRAALADRNEGD